MILWMFDVCINDNANHCLLVELLLNGVYLQSWNENLNVKGKDDSLLLINQVHTLLPFVFMVNYFVPASFS